MKLRVPLTAFGGVAGVEPRFENYEGDDPHAFVIDKNIHRRHLNESQRAMVAAAMANLSVGDNQFKREGVEISTPSLTLKKAADLLNVSEDLVSIVNAALKIRHLPGVMGSPSRV